ncbi:hypothetical protein M5F03_08290 [Acinetobacter sp. ANC 5579]|nr:hypothetical protein [Acinetobacter amyesii]MCL6235157.1 hypothetical protein [Acinetobacter amyesii]
MRCVNRNLSLKGKAQLPFADTTDAWLRQPEKVYGNTLRASKLFAGS